ncbi:MAG: glycosyltransferase [Butyrivibrio sp.]|jgi:N-acetylgalactosamine-N,N'-diacetylbacillosaminyl-diphospho-undecaprenol 4-alpha-N-acetylgalactosaminyltransferase|nr:glycosyltransferase [Butyrivibrio sp.]
MDKKNLLIIVPTLHQGGYERVAAITAKLMQDYFNVTLLIFDDKNANYDVTGVDVVNINLPSQKSKIGKVVNLIRRAIAIRNIKNKRKIDIAYSFGDTANLANSLSKAHEKTVTGLRCYTDMEAPRHIRLYTRKSDLILSCSREIMAVLEKDYKFSKTEFIYNPTDIETIDKLGTEEISDYPFEPGTKVISCMARDNYIKGIWHLIKAFSIVSKKYSDLRLMILGRGEYAANKELVKKLGLSDKVSFTGVKKNPFAYVAKSDMYVLASNHEGFPNALLEGMALGKPVVAADCKTGPREIVLSEDELDELLKKGTARELMPEYIEGAYGILVRDMSPVEDTDASHITSDDIALAHAIENMLSSEEKMQHYSDVARARACVYTPDKYAEDLQKILNKLA